MLEEEEADLGEDKLEQSQGEREAEDMAQPLPVKMEQQTLAEEAEEAETPQERDTLEEMADRV